jgi:hypothetical protein
MRFNKLTISAHIRQHDPASMIQPEKIYYFLEPVSYGRGHRIPLFDECRSIKGSEILEAIGTISNRAFMTINMAMVLDEEINKPLYFFCLFDKGTKGRHVAALSVENHTSEFFETQDPLIFRLMNDIPIDKIPCYLNDMFNTNKVFYNFLSKRMNSV